MAAFIHAMNFTKDKNSKMRDHLFSIFILLPAARYPGLIIHLNCMRKTLIPLRILSTQYAHTSASGQHNGIMMFMSNSPLNHFVKSFCKYKPNLPIISGKRGAQRRIRGSQHRQPIALQSPHKFINLALIFFPLVIFFNSYINISYTVHRIL